MNRQPRAFVLIAVLIVTMLAAMIAASLLYRMQAEASVSAAVTRGEQAYAAALSGIHTALAVLTTPPGAESAQAATGSDQPKYIADLERWFDNPQIFRSHFVADDGATKWYFTIYAQSTTDEKVVRNGLIDEAGKININDVIGRGRSSDRSTVIEAMVGRLPAITPQLMDCLLDYMDSDSDPRTEGAEQDYYDRLPKPYIIKNGPLGSIEELLMVKGFTGSVVYGEDSNFNGLLEPNEDDGNAVFPPDDADGRLNPGLAAYLTVTPFTTDYDTDSEGKPKTDINRATSEQLQEAGLPRELTTFLETYRRNGNRLTHPSGLFDLPPQPGVSQRDLGTAQVVLGLLGQVSAPGAVRPRTGGRRPAGNPGPSDAPPPSPLPGAGRSNSPPGGGLSPGRGATPAPTGRGSRGRGSRRRRGGSSDGPGNPAPGLTPQTMSILMDKFTAGKQNGRINVNTAPPEVLSVLLEALDMDRAIARQVAEARRDLDAQERISTAWLVTKGLLTPAQFAEVAPYLTARGYQYRVRCIGYCVPGGRYRVLEAVIDPYGTSKIAYLRDITRLGLPVAIEGDLDRKGR